MSGTVTVTMTGAEYVELMEQASQLKKWKDYYTSQVTANSYMISDNDPVRVSADISVERPSMLNLLALTKVAEHLLSLSLEEWRPLLSHGLEYYEPVEGHYHSWSCEGVVPLSSFPDKAHGKELAARYSLAMEDYRAYKKSLEEEEETVDEC